MTDNRDPALETVVEVERPLAGLRNATIRVMAKIYRATPRQLRPALGVAFCGCTAYLTALLNIVVLRLVFGQHRVIDHEFLLAFVGSGLVAAIVFGIAREFLKLPARVRPWALALLTSLTFWATIVFVAGWKHARNMVASWGDAFIFGIVVVVFGVAGGWVLSRNRAEREDPA